MKLFKPGRASDNARNARIYAAYEIAYTFVDFAAAISFVIGSALYFYEDLHAAGTWMFLIGSILFALKPTLRLARELSYVAEGETEVFAPRRSERRT